jgi:3-methyladenine DNA glycosylase AlkD
LWERRIAIIATQHFIRKGDFADTLKISEMLLGDSHDLMHKAVGWMLREVGKRDLAAEEAFLQRHRKKMPRTALRYAIERFPKEKRRAYMARS